VRKKEGRERKKREVEKERYREGGVEEKTADGRRQRKIKRK